MKRERGPTKAWLYGRVEELEEQLREVQSRAFARGREAEMDRLKAEQEETLRRDVQEQLHACRGARERDRLAFAATAVHAAQMESAILVFELRAKKAEQERDEARNAYNAAIGARRF